MKCKICGRNFLGESDICNNCKNGEEIETFKIKRKYSIKYNFLKYWYWAIVFLASAGVAGTKKAIVLSIITMILVFAFILILDKRFAMATKCSFNKKTINYEFKMGKIDRSRKLQYKHVNSLYKEQSLSQKICNLGNICIYADKGNLLTTGIQIKNIPNFKENYEKIKKIIEENMQ